MTDDSLIKALKKDDRTALKSLYLDHKPAFIGFAKRYDLERDDILDIYQDAIIALRENALKGHLNHLRSGLKTYLFSIGKYMIYDRLKEKKKLFVTDEVRDPDDFDNIKIISIEHGFSDRQRQMQKAFKQLGAKCQHVLTLFYFRGFTLDDIVTELNYNNKDVAKSQKARCIKTLKQIIIKTKQ